MFGASSFSEIPLSQAAEGPIGVTGLQATALVGNSVNVNGDKPCL